MRVLFVCLALKQTVLASGMLQGNAAPQFDLALAAVAKGKSFDCRVGQYSIIFQADLCFYRRCGRLDARWNGTLSNRMP